MSFSSEKERLYADLSPAQRAYADFLLRVIPNFRYELSGRPRLNPMPAPGLESAVAAAKMVSVLLQAGRPARRDAGAAMPKRKSALPLRHRRIG
jgi:hypothetical protein